MRIALLAWALLCSPARAARIGDDGRPMPPGYRPRPQTVPDHVLKDGGASARLPPGVPLLLVVHPQQHFDARASAAGGARRAAAAFNAKGWPVVYLRLCPYPTPYEPPDLDHYMTEPALEVCSEDGEHRLSVDTDRIVLAGGFDSRCLTTAALAAVDRAVAAQKRRAPNSPAVVTLELVADGVYTDGRRADSEPHPAAPWTLSRLSRSRLEESLRFMVSPTNPRFASYLADLTAGGRRPPRVESERGVVLRDGDPGVVIRLLAR